MKRRLLAVLAVLLALAPAPALAWGEYAHRQTAAIALANVSPQVRGEVGKLLARAKDLGTPDCPLKTLEDAAVRRYSAEERAGLAGGTPDDWGRESWEIARSFVYPTAFDTEDLCSRPLPDKTALSQEDIVRGVPVARRRVVQAGLRIADLLEAAFRPGPLVPDQPRRRRG